MPTKLFFPTLKTSRLILKPLVIDDADKLLAIFSDTEVMKYWSTPPWSSIQDALDFVNNSHQSMACQNAIVLGIYIQSTGELVGK